MKLGTLLLLAAAGCALSACESAKQAIGLGKNPPDEFQVVSQAPLSMPPDFNLPTPTPGVPRPQEGSPELNAQNALLANTASGGTATPTTDTTQSSGEQALLQTAGASATPDPKIRNVVDQEAAADTAASTSLLDRLAFWRTPEPAGTIVDPQAEQQRLQQNAALGQPVTAGATPTIKRKKKALLEGIF